MVVTLMRHGPCAYRGRNWLAPSTIAAWADSYDAAGLQSDAAPPAAARQAADAAALILTSDRRRAIESARCIAPGRDHEANPLWREAPLPNLAFKLHLPTGFSIGVSRIAWYLGLAVGAESVAAVRARAIVAVAELETRCRAYGHVLLVGHGIFNRFVAAALRERGWHGRRQLSSGHWATVTFSTSAV